MTTETATRLDETLAAAAAQALAGREADYLADVVMTTLAEYYEGSSVEPLEETGLRENVVRDLYEALRSKA